MPALTSLLDRSSDPATADVTSERPGRKQWWPRASLWAVGSLLLIQLWLLVPTLGLPALGRDSWRESDGLIVARNFCREGGPIGSPRIDARGAGPGITGMEFPLLNWIGGKLMCAGLPLVPTARAITLLSLLVATACVFFLARRIWSSTGAVLAAGAFGLAPVSLYYGRTVQPDMTALGLALLALLLLERALERGRPEPWRTLLSAVCMGLGCLIKLPVIVFGLPILVRVVQALGWHRVLRRPVLWAYALIAVGPALAWYTHARALQSQYGIHYFNLGQPLPQLVGELADPRFYRLIFVEHLWDVYAFPVVAGLAVLAVLTRAHRLPALAWSVALAALVGLFLAGYAGAHHVYYGLPLTAGLALLCPVLLERLPERIQQLSVLVLLVGALSYGTWRTQVWYPEPGTEAHHLRLKASVDHVAPPDARVVLFSAGDPTLLWSTDRKGWVLGPVDASWTPPVPVVLMDVRRMGEAEASITRLLVAHDFTSRFDEGGLRMWVRRAQ